MRNVVSTVAVVSLWLLGAAPARAADQLWLCHLPDGSTLYTTNPGYAGKCTEFTPSSGGLTRMPEPKPDGPSSEQDQPYKYYEKPTVTERPREDKPRPKGDLEFEKFRMLDTGMTEAEVLTRAGQPKHIFRYGRNVQHWVYALEDWLVEITFSSGRVANIDWYRPRP